MTGAELKEIDDWFAACQKAQPQGSVALLCYVRDGRVHLGRPDSAVEAEAFPPQDYLWVVGEVLKGLLPKIEEVEEDKTIVSQVKSLLDSLVTLNAKLSTDDR